MSKGELQIKPRRIVESIGETAVRTHEETNVITDQAQGMVQNLYCRMMQLLFKGLFQSTPEWFQRCLTTLYEKGRQYPLIVDFSRSFIVFFAVPFALFILWSIGSMLVSGILRM